MINKAFFELNPARSVMSVGGTDRTAFLQGLISNDTNRISNTQAIFAALLSPQGKFAYDLLLVEQNARYLVDCEQSRRLDLIKRLKMFKLRSDVILDDLENDLVVINLFGGDTFMRLGLSSKIGEAKALDDGVVFVDPRVPELGARAFLSRKNYLHILTNLGFIAAPSNSFQVHRYTLGIPEGSNDLPPDKAIPLECGFDELNGVDWEKGCYMGQELTARTKYRGLVRKRLLPIRFEGGSPAAGTDLTIDGKDIGSIRAVFGNQGLALLRLEHLGAILANGIEIEGTRIFATIPTWARLPEIVS